MTFSDYFMEGLTERKECKDAKEGKPKAYYVGYGAEYRAEQNNDARTGGDE